MGLSKPPKADFDLVDSFARRRGQDVEIVIADPRADLLAATTVVLRRYDKRVEAPARSAELALGPALVATVPLASLADGRWSVHIDGPDGAEKRISARLLVQGSRPLVLLWGGTSPSSAVPPPSRPATTSQAVASTAGKVIDRALTTLPADRREQVRGAARSAARRVLG